MVDSGNLVQRIDLAEAKSICHGTAIYIASPSTCWRIEAVQLTRQIRDLLALRKFGDALELAQWVDEDRQAKAVRIADIKTSYAAPCVLPLSNLIPVWCPAPFHHLPLWCPTPFQPYTDVVSYPFPSSFRCGVLATSFRA
jgi:hypothetical protein